MASGWEYKTLVLALSQGQLNHDRADEQLEELGEENWELLTVSPIVVDGTTARLVYHFRRPREPRRRVGFNA